MQHDHVYESALLISIGIASTFIQFVADGTIDAIISRRFFTIIALLVALGISFHVDPMYSARYVLAVLGPSLVNTAIALVTSLVPVVADDGVRKRRD
jgi:hypothetical protein